jgi:hypothetical protein
LLRLKNSAVGGQDTSPMAEDGESLGGLRECPLKKRLVMFRNGYATPLAGLSPTRDRFAASGHLFE